MIDRARRAGRKLAWEIVKGGPGRPRRVLTVPTENGLLSFSNMDRFVARPLYVQRSWEMNLITRSMDYLRSEGWIHPDRDVVIDVGANIGMVCIAMLTRGYFREALAFEPGPENFQFLERNVAQNGLAGRIHPFPYALTDRSGTVELELSDVNFGDHRVRAAATDAPALMREAGRETLPVPARTLDEVLAATPGVDPGRIGLIWVDTQGHEGHFFRGAGETLGRGMPVLSEFWPYGILRSGFNRDRYAETVRSFFSRAVVVDAEAGRFEPRGIGELGALFDAHRRPEEHLEVIYLPRERPIRG
jgi:FkbM family methyltransferase